MIPASAFFEFVGTKTPKAKVRFTLNKARFMGIAGLWRTGSGNQPDGFTMLTTAPGPDVARFPSRQVVILRPEAWELWLMGTGAEPELLRPLPAGSFKAELALQGKDSVNPALFDQPRSQQPPR